MIIVDWKDHDFLHLYAPMMVITETIKGNVCIL